MRRIILALAAALALLITAVFALGPAVMESSMNRVQPHAAYELPPEARELHDSLLVADLHTDSTLWRRDLLQRGDRGHVDLPRLREGNVALQMFTAVTRSPAGQNYDNNAADGRDNITLLALLQRWPPDTWNSLAARASYQARKLQRIEELAPEQFRLMRSGADIEWLVSQRRGGGTVIGGILGTEGSHALDGKLESIDRLYADGFRVMGLQHFFDNRLGGSLHGESGGGLSEFGRQAVDRMLARGIIIDVAHSSPQVVRDTLARSDRPVLVSHSGFYGHCQTARNISDELMQRIAAAGGLIGVGFWDAAVCDPSPAGIVGAIRYGIELVGVDHVALGSDYDGSIEAPFDISEIAVLTREMLAADFSEEEIRKVMGGNMLRFMQKNLPAGR